MATEMATKMATKMATAMAAMDIDQVDNPARDPKIITDLPCEILGNVLRHLEPKDIPSVLLSCKTMHLAYVANGGSRILWDMLQSFIPPDQLVIAIAVNQTDKDSAGNPRRGRSLTDAWPAVLATAPVVNRTPVTTGQVEDEAKNEQPEHQNTDPKGKGKAKAGAGDDKDGRYYRDYFIQLQRDTLTVSEAAKIWKRHLIIDEWANELWAKSHYRIDTFCREISRRQAEISREAQIREQHNADISRVWTAAGYAWYNPEAGRTAGFDIQTTPNGTHVVHVGVHTITPVLSSMAASTPVLLYTLPAADAASSSGASAASTTTQGEPSGQPGGLGGVQLPNEPHVTYGEQMRIQRAFYRAELFFHVFNGIAPQNPERPDHIRRFFKLFPPWINEQLACIFEFLEDMLQKGLDKVAPHDIEFGVREVDWIERAVTNPWKQRFMALGVVQIFDLVWAKSFEERRALLPLDRPHPANLRHAFRLAASDVPGTMDDVIATWRRRLEEENGDNPAFGCDFEQGPEKWWQRYHDDAKPDCWVFCGTLRRLRRRGYAMWDWQRPDHSHLEHVFREAFATSDSVPALPRDYPSRRGLMVASFRQRKALAAEGQTGYWTQPENTPVPLPVFNDAEDAEEDDLWNWDSGVYYKGKLVGEDGDDWLSD